MRAARLGLVRLVPALRAPEAMSNSIGTIAAGGKVEYTVVDAARRPVIFDPSGQVWGTPSLEVLVAEYGHYLPAGTQQIVEAAAARAWVMVDANHHRRFSGRRRDEDCEVR